MSYYGSRNNGKTFLKAMIEPSKWSSSEDSGCVTTAYSFSRDAQWLIENFCKLPISDLSSCLASKVSSEFLFERQKWKLQVWLNYENEHIELNLLRKGPSIVGDNGDVEISFGIKSIEGKVVTFERRKYSMDSPCEDWTSAVKSKCLLRSRLYREMESLPKGNGLIVYCMIRLVEVSTCFWDSTLLDKTNNIGNKPVNEIVNDENVKTEDEEKEFSLSKVDSKSNYETAIEENGKIKSEDRKFTSPKALVTLSQNLKNLYLSRKGCDVNIKVKNKTFSAHRVILWARTPSLISMLPENTEESETESLSVEDCDPEAFEIFLMFVYTGMTENLTADNVMFVYYLAVKYGLLELKDDCVQYMMSSLTIDNICDVFCLALSHDEKSLKIVSTKFFKKNANDIFQTAKWDDFMVKNNCVAKDIILDALKENRRII